jgi:transposase
VPRPHPPEFRRRAVELANQRDANGKRLQPVAQTAAELGISDSCLRNPRCWRPSRMNGTKSSSSPDSHERGARGQAWSYSHGACP